MSETKTLDYIEALKSIMTTRQSRLTGPRAVLTTAPWLWLGDKCIADQDKIIDISFKFPRQPVRFDSGDGPTRDFSRVKAELYDRLIFAGWTPDLIDTRASRSIDGLGQSDFSLKVKMSHSTSSTTSF